MDGLTGILRAQWRSYWRRLLRPGGAGKSNLVVLALLTVLAFARYVPFLRTAGAELAKGRPETLELILAGVFAAWLLLVAGESSSRIFTRGLLLFPLSLRRRFLVRTASLATAPITWLLAAASVAPLIALPRAAQRAALALYLLLAVATALGVSHLSRVALAVMAAAAAALGFAWRGFPVAAMVIRARPLDLAVLALLGAAASVFAVWSFGNSLLAQPRPKKAPFEVRVPGRLGGLIYKEIRAILGIVDQFVAVLIALAFGAYLVTTPHPEPDALRAVLIFISVFSLSVPLNSFGLDAPSGVDRYRLLPLAGKQIILVKNIAFTSILMAPELLLLPLAFWRYGWLTGAFAVVEAASLALSVLAWGNFISVRHPYRMQNSGGEGGSVVEQMGALVCSAFPGAAAIALFRSSPGSAPIALLCLLLLCAAFYAWSVPRAGRQFERRSDQIRELLT